MIVIFLRAIAVTVTHRGGGIAVIYKDILHPLLSFRESLPFAARSFESVEFIFKQPGQSIIFTCLYRPPPSRQNKLTASLFHEEFSALFDHYSLSTSKLLLLGNFHFRFDDLNSSDTNRIRQLINNHNLSQLILEPTHRSGHIIDWITAREYDNLVSSVSVTDQLESEHKAVLAYFNPSKSLRNSRLVIRRKLKPIRKINLVLTLPNVSPSYHLLLIQHHITTQISAILDEHASATTRLLCQAKRERRQAKRRWRSTKLTVHRQIYQIEKQKV